MHTIRLFTAQLLVLFVFAGLTAAARPGVVLVGKTAIPATATDLSGLTEKLEDGTPHNRLGAHGSSIAYTGKGNRYIMACDRGPADGTVAWRCRVHLVDITVTGKSAAEATLKETILLKDEEGKSFVGIASAFDKERPAASMRLDPEGVRVARDGTIWISDEYGPYVYHFDTKGKRIGSVRVPEKFLIAKPMAKEQDEIAANKSGRVTNKGMEGLAITPDGSALVGAMQSPLIQDGGKQGVNHRLIRFDLKTGATREYVYPISKAGLYISEIVAVNDHEFLVDERDSKGGKQAQVKKLFLIDLEGASDVSGRDALPKDSVPEGVVPVKKKLFLDLLAERHHLAGPDFPAKIEGLAFGPDLPDGRHLLIITSDNDLKANEPTWIYAFAIDKDLLPNYKAQQIDEKK